MVSVQGQGHNEIFHIMKIEQVSVLKTEAYGFYL